ncbi:MAG: hypothetical protein WDO19_12060 [Bacteroidota bacterium]
MKRQTSPTIKLINDPISGPPICLPSLVLRIACSGIIAPMINVKKHD